MRDPSAHGGHDMKPLAFALVFGLLAAPGAAAEVEAPQALLDQMAQGKIEADLGRHEEAAKMFAAVAATSDAPRSLRGEALVRQGTAERAAGKLEAAVRTFERAAREYGDDNETARLLVLAGGGAMPSAERWEKIRSRVSFTVDRSDPEKPDIAIVWPDVPPRAGRYKGETITLDFKDGDLNDIFSLYAEMTGLNVVVNP